MMHRYSSANTYSRINNNYGTMKKILTALAVVFSVFSCGTNKNTETLDEKKLNITEINGKQYIKVSEDAGTLSFHNGMCSVYLGGNLISASYKESRKGALKFMDGGSTKMAVPEEYREEEFLSVFYKTASYKLENGVYLFLDADGKILFKATK